MWPGKPLLAQPGVIRPVVTFSPLPPSLPLSGSGGGLMDTPVSAGLILIFGEEHPFRLGAPFKEIGPGVGLL